MSLKGLVLEYIMSRNENHSGKIDFLLLTNTNPSSLRLVSILEMQGQFKQKYSSAVGTMISNNCCTGSKMLMPMPRKVCRLSILTVEYI